MNRRTHKWRDWAGGAFIFGLALGLAVQISERPAITASPGYTPEQVSYFLDVAMGGEFGASPEVIRKWQGPVRIKVHGTPTPEDLTALRQTIQEVEGLANGLQIYIVHDLPNLDLHFVPESDFRKYEPNYQPLNYGFFWTHWHQSGEIYRARILISTVGVSQSERSHLIREELTQALGLMQDSTQYPDSIFFQGWTDHTQFSDIDRAVIKMLYHPAIQPGMTREQVIQALAIER